MSKMSEETYAKIEDHLVNMVAGEAKPVDVDYAMHLIHSYTQEKCREAEIALLRETAEGFQLVLEPEFARGGQAAINALIKMADHKEGELEAQLNKSKGE